MEPSENFDEKNEKKAYRTIIDNLIAQQCQFMDFSKATGVPEDLSARPKTKSPSCSIMMGFYF
ncbi:MAG: hypothetical protein CVU60_02555 [Deltaproteobacteria bacterium HGW-Deltaproteobacteria-18]|nr:MAG: hypothetical protein CVU60_02555 [Deltaproteobacteria bacterium HGW-Deltaproteobacteria-18]